MSQMPYPLAAKSPMLSSMVSVTSAADSGAPSNRNRRTSGCVQWASSAAWSSAVTGRSTRRSVLSTWSTPPDYPAGRRAARLPGTALACG